MNNIFDNVRQAVSEARDVNRAVDQQVNAMLDLLDGRLHKADPRRIVELKRALRSFDAHKLQWKAPR